VAGIGTLKPPSGSEDHCDYSGGEAVPIICYDRRLQNSRFIELSVLPAIVPAEQC